jgi:tRNA(Arg) A34 adenosine deaminase TadA
MGTEGQQGSEQAAKEAQNHHWRKLCAMLHAIPELSTVTISTKKTDGTMECFVVEKCHLLQAFANAKYMQILVIHLIKPVALWQKQHSFIQNIDRPNCNDNDPLSLLPRWAQEEFQAIRENCSDHQTDEERIEVAIDMSQKNVDVGGQEPFACIIYQHASNTGRTTPYVLGVNHEDRHAETMALHLVHARFSEQEQGPCEPCEYWMYSSCEPCCDCFGTLVLLIATLRNASNSKFITRLVTAATKADAETLGFDEGPINDASYHALQEIFGIEVIRGMQREQSANVIRGFGKQMSVLSTVGTTSKSTPPFSSSGLLVSSSSEEISMTFREDGFVVLRKVLDASHLQAAWHPYAATCFQQVFEILHGNGYIDRPADRNAENGTYTMRQGLKDGFSEVVMRSPGRYEISLLHLLPGIENRISSTRLKLPSLPDLPQDLLQPIHCFLPSLLGNGENMKLIHLSLLVSTPGSTDQAWHADGPHATAQSTPGSILPCHAYNIFIPLQVTPCDMGPTELRPASHNLTQGNLAKNMLLAKCKKMLRPLEWPEMELGDVLIFDYRILHRGRANNTGVNRNYLVLTYAESWFEDRLNFPKRSMYEKRNET